MAEFDPNLIDPLAQQLADQVLVASQTMRANEQASRDSLVQQAEQARQEADYAQARGRSKEVILAREVGKLAARMLSLSQNPWQKSLLGRKVARSNIPVTFDDNLSAVTSPITDGQILQITDVHYLRSGLVFGRPVLGERQVFIKQVVKDELNGVQATRQLYHLHAYDSPTGMRVFVDEAEFNTYREARRQEAHDRYTATYPWASGCQYTWMEERVTLLHRDGEPAAGSFWAWDFGSPKHEESKERARQLDRELGPHMNPGASWEFPDEMFRESLGLTLEANLLLGATK